MKLSNSVKVVILICSVVMSMAACTPFTKVQGDDKTVAKINGSWTVIHSGGEKLEGLEPKPTIIFNTSNNTISGFDGCNNYKGSYSFTDGKLRAKVASTRMACTSDVARGVSEQMADLFNNGADVVEVSLYGQHVIMLKNSSAELRLGPSDLLN